MNARHEFKHNLNYADYFFLRGRLRAVFPHDENTNEQGEYLIRSLYFDTPSDTALREKLDGVNDREKFRIRFYNGDTSFLRLERKAKHNGLCYKSSTAITEQEAQALVDGDLDWMKKRDDPLLWALYSRMCGRLLAPKTIVDYIREPFIFAPGNVRITLDRALHTGLHCTDFMNMEVPMVPVEGTATLLEVKYDNFLPHIVADVIHMNNRSASAFSKYANCRVYG